MTTKIDFKLLASITGGIIFNCFFWNENTGVNLLLFAIFIISVLLFDKLVIKNKRTIVTGGLFLFSGLMVLYNNSDLAIIAYYISLFVFVGCVHAQNLKTILTAILAAATQYLSAPVSLFKKILNARVGKFSLKPIFHILKYLIIPIFVIIIFGVLYSNANSIFGKYVGDAFSTIGDAINQFFSFFFADLSFLRFMHFIFGIIFCAGIFIAYKHTALETFENSQHTQLIRRRRTANDTSVGRDLIWTFTGDLLTRNMALKTENIIGVISFAALNVLILSLNLIDLSTLWLSTGLKTDLNYSAELHNGTDTLIISIVLAMIVIVYFFNGNLNFYSKNKTIKALAFIWIFQNLFLILTVIHKDSDYIAAQGLTYKRIGVFVFSLLCIIGLVSVYVKVAKRKTFFYLLKTNTSIWFGILLLSTIFNWDAFIVDYNIQHRKTIALDYYHLVSLSDKTIPLLHKNRGILATQAYKVNDTTTSKKLTNNDYLVKVMLREKIDAFKTRQKETSFLSWNYRDWETERYLLNVKY